MRLKTLLYFSILLPYASFSQKIDNTASFRNQGTANYFRFNYDNDYFAANDYYYTQGYNFEIAGPQLKKNPLSKLLVRLKDSTITYGLAFEHYGFTPTSIRHDEILVNDRPFSSLIMLKSFVVSVNTQKRERLASILSTGMIGPIAFGEEMQRTIHRWIGGIEPHGWQHQIRNDVVLTYELNHEKWLYNSSLVSLNTNANMRLGTLNTKAQTGVTLTLGKRSFPLNNSSKSKYEFYIYSQPLVNFIAYDATLQGTFFNESPYTIKASDITRVNLQHNFGAFLKLNKVNLEYSRAMLGKEFRTGKYHQWGGIRIGFAI